MTTVPFSTSPTGSAAPSIADRARVTAAAWVLILAGLGFVALAVAAPDMLALLYRLLAAGGTDATINPAALFGAALFGALTFGWGVTLHQLGRGMAIGHALRVSVIAWFVVDSTASVLLGFAGNVVLNIGFAVVLLLLLRAPRR